MKTIEEIVRLRMGVWPFSDEFHTMYWCAIGKYYTTNPNNADAFCTRTQFEECARRLRNEPSFDDHPDAKCLMQNADGTWFKNISTDQVNPGTRGWNCRGSGFLFVQKGEVIGNWRQTLRLRSEEEKVENETKARTLCANCATNKTCPAANLSGAHQVFACAAYVPNTKDQNDWHKRGEFPPVGTVCEMRRVGEGFAKGALMYHSAELCVWRFISSSEIALMPDQCEFRPIQTEREELIEEAITLLEAKTDKPLNAFAVGLITHLIDAGFKMPKGE